MLLQRLGIEYRADPTAKAEICVRLHAAIPGFPV